jgi:hypothetical protein
MVSTVFKLVEGPFFRRIVTAPLAPDHVRLNGVPVLTLANDEAGIVNCAALARAKAAAATRTLENCILMGLRVFEID